MCLRNWDSRDTAADGCSSHMSTLLKNCSTMKVEREELIIVKQPGSTDSGSHGLQI